MKKMMIALAMIITLTTVAFASDTEVKNQILDAFRNKFTSAQDVKWTMSNNNHYHASFLYKGMRMDAFYDTSGELLGLTRHINSTQLPYHLQSKLEKYLNNQWITELFEVSNDEGFSYYVTLENADHKIILESKGGTGWTQYKKTKISRSF